MNFLLRGVQTFINSYEHLKSVAKLIENSSQEKQWRNRVNELCNIMPNVQQNGAETFYPRGLYRNFIDNELG